MAEQAKPRISNVTKFFIPGLAIGIFIGAVGGVYLGPRFEGPSMQKVETKSPGGSSTPRLTGRPDDAPTIEGSKPKEPAPAAATGSTGTTGSTTGTGAPK